MRVFVSEYLTCGACDAPPQSSLLREGRAMLRAISLDFATIDDCRVVTTWDARLDPVELPGVEVIPVAGATAEMALFRKLAGECDATFVIAPETGGVLAARRRVLDELGACALLSDVAAIELAADKLRLAPHLVECGIRTIPTIPLNGGWRESREQLADIAASGDAFGWRGTAHLVVKPRDGAGALGTFIVSDREQFERSRHEFDESGTDAIVQPFIAGQAVSIAAIIGREGATVELLPVAEQRIVRHEAPSRETGREGESNLPQLAYEGGRVPAAEIDVEPVRQLARDAIAAVPGLARYVGCDLIVPVENPGAPLLVEINPRLTTSYLGYRAFAAENLAERILLPNRTRPPIRWHAQPIEFDPDGVCHPCVERSSCPS